MIILTKNLMILMLFGWLKFTFFSFTLIGEMARPSPGAPPPSSPLTSSTKLAAAGAAPGGPQLTTDPIQLPHRWCWLCRGRYEAHQPPSDLAGHRLVAVVLSLARQDRRDVLVGGRRQKNRIVFPPYWQSGAAKVLGIAKKRLPTFLAIVRNNSSSTRS